MVTISGITLAIITQNVCKTFVKMSDLYFNESDSIDLSVNSERQIERNSVGGCRIVSCAPSTETVIFVSNQQGSQPPKV
jgi:hypothetical protein